LGDEEVSPRTTAPGNIGGLFVSAHLRPVSGRPGMCRPRPMRSVSALLTTTYGFSPWFGTLLPIEGPQPMDVAPAGLSGMGGGVVG